MAEVTGMTAAAMQDIRDNGVVNGDIDEFGHLILIQHDGGTIDAGSIRGSFDAATETAAGIVELATTVEAAAGVDTTRAVTAAGVAAAMSASIPDASDTVKGKVELATNAEAITGTDIVRAVTPAAMTAAVNSLVPSASATTQGKVELATDAETTTGTDTTRATTPANVKAAIDARVASTTAAGIVELATTAEATAETDTVRAVTPAGLADRAKLASPTFTGTVTAAALTLTGALTAVGATLSGRLSVTPDTLTDAATIAVDASLGNNFTVTLGGNRTLGNPTNAVDGQMLLFRIRQDGTGTRTLSLDTKYRFGTDITSITLSTAINKTDYLGVRYHASDDKFDVIAFVKGY